MKHHIQFVCLLLCASALPAQTRYDVQMRVDSVQREFILSVPSAPAPTAGYPLVFMFHGTSQDGEKFYNDSQWKEKGEQERFISVFPTALRYCIVEDGQQRVTTKWHSREIEDIACPGQYLKDDVRFVRTMIDSIRSRFPIDARRIYASGFSNGASFTSRLAVEMSDVFAAVGVSGGALGERDSAKALRNIPVWFVLGTLDDKWLPHFPQFTEFPFNDTTLVLLSRNIKRFLGAFGLAEPYRKTEAGRTLNYVFDTPAGAEPATEFRYTLVNNMFHVYPDGSNVPFVAANIFWDFFNQYTTPVSVAQLPETAELFSVFPNPAHEFIVIDGVTDGVMIIRNLIGQEMHRAYARPGVPVRLPRLTAGVYSVELESGARRAVRTVAIR